MVEKISTRSLVSVEKVFKSFVNLLKEFPRNASDDFIYDASTLKKINLASQSLSELYAFLKERPSAFKKEMWSIIHQSLDILSRLINELPRNSRDEFSYEPGIHQMVEEAREAIIKMGDLFS